jgi:hypothetical protein
MVTPMPITAIFDSVVYDYNKKTIQMGQRSDPRDIAVTDAGILIENIMNRVMERLNAGKGFDGIGCLLKKDREDIPLLFQETEGDTAMSPSFYKRIFQALREEVTNGRAIGSGIANGGNSYLDGNRYATIIINIFHEVLDNEVITYIVPYVSGQGKVNKDFQDILLMDDASQLEFNNI